MEFGEYEIPSRVKIDQEGSDDLFLSKIKLNRENFQIKSLLLTTFSLFERNILLRGSRYRLNLSLRWATVSLVESIVIIRSLSSFSLLERQKRKKKEEIIRQKRGNPRDTKTSCITFYNRTEINISTGESIEVSDRSYRRFQIIRGVPCPGRDFSFFFLSLSFFLSFVSRGFPRTRDSGRSGNGCSRAGTG